MVLVWKPAHAEGRQGGHTGCDGWVEAQFDHALVSEGGRDPRRRAHEAGQGSPFNLLQVGNDLDGARAVADDADPFVAEVVPRYRMSVGVTVRRGTQCSPRVPLSRVHDLALKLVKPGNVRPSDVVELPASSNQDICCVFERFSSGEVRDPDLPVASQRPSLGESGLGLTISSGHHPTRSARPCGRS